MIGSHVATFPELPSTTLYALLKLRVDVFVAEQGSPYPDLDGRDAEPGTRHVWLSDGADGEPLAYLRILADTEGGGAEEVARIGRVCVAAGARGAGHGHRLMEIALDLVAGRACRLEAQSHLVGFYAAYGFAPAGPEYVEDGVPHVPMYRPAGGGPAGRDGRR